MAKNKKSLLSVAAAVAISSTLLSAAYLPLTNTSNDNEWILVGMSAYGGDNTAALGEFSIADDDANVWIDAAEAYLVATPSNANPTLSFGELKVVSGTSSVEARVDVSGLTLNETNPIRTIYVATEVGGTPVFGFTYRAILEGKYLEYTIGSSTTVYRITLDSDNTYDNPAIGVINPANVDSTGAMTSLNDATQGNTEDNQILDYNLTNNPFTLSNYNDPEYGNDDNGSTSTRIYRFNAASEIWESFDSRNSATGNDFDTLTAGRGYWAKMNLDGSGQVGGLIVGEGSVSSTTLTDNAGLTPGWNLVSFGNSNTEIRNSTTGILVDINTTNTGGFYLYDASMTLPVEVNTTAGDTNTTVAGAINLAVAKAKAQGIIPRIFDVKAFPAPDATHGVAIISNKKFGILDGGANILGAATPLNGTQLWSPDDNQATTVTDINSSKKIASMYGEYMLLIEPNAALTTVNANVQAKAEVVVHLDQYGAGTSSKVTVATDTDTARTAFAAVTNLSALAIDKDLDGTSDYLLLVSDEPFYLRDYTFTRVYKATDSGTAGTYKISKYDGTSTAAITGIADGNATQSAIDINSTVPTKVAAVDDGNGNVVVYTTEDNGGNLAVLQVYDATGNNGDNLDIGSSSANVAMGAIKHVWDVDTFVARGVKSSLDINLTLAGIGDVNETIALTYYTQSGNVLQGSELNVSTTGATALTDLVALIKAQVADLNISATVTQNTTSDGALLVGTDLIDVRGDINATVSPSGDDVNATASLGLINIPSAGLGGLTENLKFNSVYTPNYVESGPLYTMNEAGYKLEALVTGYTNISDGKIGWESIDLTRSPADWLNSQDYNLFQTDSHSAYWAYINNAAASTMTISNISPDISYTSYFGVDGDAKTSKTYIQGSIEVTLTGVNTIALEDNTVRVFATIDGEKIELSKDAAGLYTGNLNALEVGVGSIGGGDKVLTLEITVVDGLGNKLNSTSTTIDNLKPTTFTLSQVDVDEVTVSASSADVASYYVFQDVVPEIYTTGNELVKVAASGNITGMCAGATAVSTGDAPGTLKVVAVDGTGLIGGGNVSDIASLAYMPIVKSRFVVTDYNTGGTSDASTGGTNYDASCSAIATYTNNEYGVSITSETTNSEVKLAYTPITNNLGYSTPVTWWVGVTDGATTYKAKIDFAEDYLGKTGFIMLNGKTYDLTFPATKVIAESTTDGSPYSINATTDLKTGVTF